MPAFRELVSQTQAVEEEIPNLMAKLAEVQRLIESERIVQIRKELLALLDEQRQRRLQMGDHH